MSLEGWEWRRVSEEGREGERLKERENKYICDVKVEYTTMAGDIS